ncbi:helix-turn-helix domain-containing protein [Streptomyces sp. SID4919]|uniref:helix-turn-helix domain-containing protein n=1 Tax=unclassified Streptomyces TaxID=2593676 RepID=UPI000823C6F9|nr:helix-turn-helix transcriptional regulator [Streptomyces sp. AmelKG-E11A]MYY13004.1 helix-turn-helix domain-containing protein [Streptomyces sp. SID4919]SCK23122.1 Predicted transcriptional regulators [Streptomyces sp. AmelKG-E11A]
MSFDVPRPDPYADPVAFGQRLRILRTRRGLTREHLGGLVGFSAQWVKDLETGRRKVPRLSVMLRLAEVLRVANLADLMGERCAGVNLFTGPGHARLGEVKAAVDAFPLVTRREAPPVAHLAARVARAWAARHSSPHHRDVIGALLPELLRDAQLSVRQSDRAAERRAAQAVLAEVYSLAQFFIAYQPDTALLWRVVERGLIAAQESEDPHVIGVAAWLAAQAHRDLGPAHFDAADAVNLETLAYLEPFLPDASPEVLAIAGALTFEAGYTAARRGETGTAWRYWDQARPMAERLPAGYYHPVTSFSRTVMGAHAVTIAVELRSGGESVRQAAAADVLEIPSRPRRARHRIEEARGYQLDGQPDVALATLEKAHRSAPETIKYNGYAKRIVLEETASKVPARRRRASALAVTLGMLAA